MANVDSFLNMCSLDLETLNYLLKNVLVFQDTASRTSGLNK